MRKIALLTALTSLFSFGCTLENNMSDCGENLDLGQKGVCECTAPDDDVNDSQIQYKNSGSVNHKDANKKDTTSCAGLLKSDSSYDYYCVNYLCRPVCNHEHELYDEVNNKCVCDEANGYIKFGNKCQMKSECKENEEYNADTNVCDCPKDKGFVVFEENCVKEAVCNEVVDFEVLDKNSNTCKCIDGYVKINEKCEESRENKCEFENENQTGRKEIYNESRNICICNDERHWVDNDGNCQCDDDYEENAEGICIDKKSGCYPNEKYEGGNCVCDSERHWVGTHENCTCDNDSTQVLDACLVDGDLCNNNSVFYKKRCVNRGDYKNGKFDEIEFGRYPQIDETPTPITWLVLDIKEGELMLISKYALDVKPYNDSLNQVTWENSTIRSWLNGYDASVNYDKIDYSTDNFIHTAFTDAEIGQILEASIDNPAGKCVNADQTITGPDGGNNTKDKIFLLSENEAKNIYFKNNSIRMAKATPYAVNVKNAYAYKNDYVESYNENYYYNTNWLLRSLGCSSQTAFWVGFLGDTATSGLCRKINSAAAIRPVIHLNIRH